MCGLMLDRHRLAAVGDRRRACGDVRFELGGVVGEVGVERALGRRGDRVILVRVRLAGVEVFEVLVVVHSERPTAFLAVELLAHRRLARLERNAVRRARGRVARTAGGERNREHAGEQHRRQRKVHAAWSRLHRCHVRRARGPARPPAAACATLVAPSVTVTEHDSGSPPLGITRRNGRFADCRRPAGRRRAG